MGLPDHLTSLLRNLYAGQEATVRTGPGAMDWLDLLAGQETTVRTGHGTTDWFQTGKEYIKAVYWHPAYLTCMQSTS